MILRINYIEFGKRHHLLVSHFSLVINHSLSSERRLGTRQCRYARRRERASTRDGALSNASFWWHLGCPVRDLTNLLILGLRHRCRGKASMASRRRQPAAPFCSIGGRGLAVHVLAVVVLAASWAPLLYELPGADAMRLSRAWTEKHWCESVEEPEWPFAYEKFPGHEFEKKGRTNSNKYVRRSTKKRPMR